MNAYRRELPYGRLTGSFDYVFDPRYRIGEVHTELAANIEELTLHMSDAEPRNYQLQQQDRQLEARVSRLEDGHHKRTNAR